MNVNEIIKYEYNLYFPAAKPYIKEKLLDSDTYKIYKWQVALRKEEYYLELQKTTNFSCRWPSFIEEEKISWVGHWDLTFRREQLSRGCIFGMPVRL